MSAEDWFDPDDYEPPVKLKVVRRVRGQRLLPPSIVELERQVLSLTADLVAREKEITKLNQYLAHLASRVTVLEFEKTTLSELLAKCRDELEYWTPDETMATADESEALNHYYSLRDRIDAVQKQAA